MLAGRDGVSAGRGEVGGRAQIFAIDEDPGAAKLGFSLAACLRSAQKEAQKEAKSQTLLISIVNWAWPSDGDVRSAVAENA